MGLLDGIVGGLAGATIVSSMQDFIQKHGGVHAIVEQFEKQGLGETVKSWVSTGPNRSIGTDEVHRVLGSDTVKQLAAKFGVSTDEVAAKIAQYLPQAVDKMTPTGELPKG